MQKLAVPPAVETVEATEHILAQTFADRLRLREWERLGGNRSNVFRCKLSESAGDLPASVIVKKAVAQRGERYDPEAVKGPAWRLFNEWAGYAFLEQISAGSPLAPRLYGGDRGAGVIVFEDLGDGARLVQLLLGNDPVQAKKGLIDLFATLGKMHALAIDSLDAYAQIRAALGPSEPLAHSEIKTNEHMDDLFNALEEVSIRPSPGFIEEAESAIQARYAPGPFLSYLHRDPCPDNCIHTDSGMKILDFEFGEYGHALSDAMFARMSFPTCWCINQIEDEIVWEIETAYQTELAVGCPEAADHSRFYEAVTEMCVFWTLTSFTWCMPDVLHRDHEAFAGRATQRQCVLLRFNRLAELIEEHRYLTSIGETSRDIASKLSQAWGMEADDMPYYPAFM